MREPCIQVLYGDCRSLLQSIKTNSIDLCVADPPYDLSQPEKIGRIAQKDGYGTGVPDLKSWLWDSKRVVSMDGHVLVWEHPSHIENVLTVGRSVGLVYRTTLVWYASNRWGSNGPNGTFSKWDACIVFSKGRKMVVDGGYSFDDVFTDSIVLDGPVPGAKPLSVMRSIVRAFTKEGDWVLDPFAGSGTTARACLELGRNCVTMEIRRHLKPYLDSRLLKGVKRLDVLL